MNHSAVQIQIPPVVIMTKIRDKYNSLHVVYGHWVRKNSQFPL